MQFYGPDSANTYQQVGLAASYVIKDQHEEMYRSLLTILATAERAASDDPSRTASLILN